MIARSFARIHAQNLVNFGILPLTFEDPEDWARIDQGDVLLLRDIRQRLVEGSRLELVDRTKRRTCRVAHELSGRQREIVLAGGLINLVRARHRVGATS